MPISDLLASITGEKPSPVQASTLAPQSQKRKAEGELRSTTDKAAKRDSLSSNTIRPVIPIKKPSSLNPAPAAEPRSATKSPAIQSPLNSTSSWPSAIPAGSNVSAKPPKKGSFAEIMARGKAATATMGQVGKIQHKRIEKVPSKRERDEEKKAQKTAGSKATGGKSRPAVSGQPPLRDGKNGARENGKIVGKTVVAEKKVKKAALATTGYTGTARPVPGKATPGSSRPGGSLHRDRDRPRPGHSRKDEYLGTDDEEEDEDGEEEDYYSDASSDMEAATFEVDEEEERAARIARKEDAAALAEENKLKREKEEKRKRLAAMAKSRR